MSDAEILARNYTDTEMHRLLLDVFSHVPESRTPFFVRLLRHEKRGSNPAPQKHMKKHIK